MKKYNVIVIFENPYIGSRNGGNSILLKNESLDKCVEYMEYLAEKYFNEWQGDWRKFCKKTKDKFNGGDGRYKSSKMKIRYDSRIFEIVKK